MREIGIDLGTANTVVCQKGKGVVLRQPSVVAVDTRRRQIAAMGSEALNMVDRTPAVLSAVYPLRSGVIADFELATALLRYVLRHQTRRSLGGRARVVIGLPSGVTGVERRAVEEAARTAGAREVTLVEEPMAAALGAGLPVHQAGGYMVVDIGGGTAEAAVLSLGDIVTKTSIRTAGDAWDTAIQRHLKEHHRLLIGKRAAEAVKCALGSAYPVEEEGAMMVKGRHLVDGLPRTVVVTSEEIRDALREPVSVLTAAVRRTLEATPPALAADVLENGILLTGGGAQLRGLDWLLGEETGVPVQVADSPLDCVAKGTVLCFPKR